MLSRALLAVLFAVPVSAQRVVVPRVAPLPASVAPAVGLAPATLPTSALSAPGTP
ncbi:MAG: hypothetical protein FD126_3593, partial [Elusimicrobia bacterium]